MFVTIFCTTFIPNSRSFHSEHHVFFYMSGDRSEHLLREIVMKSWCEMSLSHPNLQLKYKKRFFSSSFLNSSEKEQAKSAYVISTEEKQIQFRGGQVRTFSSTSTSTSTNPSSTSTSTSTNPSSTSMSTSTEPRVRVRVRVQRKSHSKREFWIWSLQNMRSTLRQHNYGAHTNALVHKIDRQKLVIYFSFERQK